MSTCPNKELFSAYLDGEIPSPWKERLADHLQKCYECQKRYDSYQKLHTLMQRYAFPSEKDFVQSFSLLATKRKMALRRKKSDAKKMKKHWIHSSVSVPAPACAAALLLLVFMPVFFFMRKEPHKAPLSTDSFKPIIPVSLEQQHRIRQLHSSGLYSNDIPYSFLQKRIISEELFTIGDFMMLYADRKELFPDLPTVSLTTAVADAAVLHQWEISAAVQPTNDTKTALRHK
ncbi:MAG: anti-sigma factor family protein [Treponema sp.]